MRVARAIAALLTVVALAAPAFGTAPSSYEVIVNPQSAVQEVDRKFLADAFLKKLTRWDDESEVHPVDQPVDSPLRQRFSSEVLERSVSAVKSYWQQHIFSGRSLPPPELSSDAQVVAYVVEHPGAVGYVSVGADLRGARILGVR